MILGFGNAKLIFTSYKHRRGRGSARSLPCRRPRRPRTARDSRPRNILVWWFCNSPPFRHPGAGGCNLIDRLQPVSRKPGRFGEHLWYRLRKHKLASVQKLFFWTRDSRDRTKLLRSFPWAELDYILAGRGPSQP